MTSDKTALRRTLRETRRALSDKQQQQAAAGLLEQLQTLDAFSQSQRIALYLPNDGEIDPSAVIDWCAARGRQSYLPVVQQIDGVNFLKFAPVDRHSAFSNNRFGIAEPVVSADALIEADELDLVLLPLVGFDESGNRIGMGGGFYDRTFAFLAEKTTQEATRRKPLLIGIAHEIQKVLRIDAESWDVPLSTVVTANQVYHLSRRSGS